MELNRYIDHTLLKADAEPADIIDLCNEACDYNFKSVCVNSGYTALASEQLKNTGIHICTVVGFPLGAMDSEVKAYEAKKAIENGADEIDMVINIGRLKASDYEYVKEDIEKVFAQTKDKAILKVIIEAGLLNEYEIMKVCQIIMKSGAEFVKTSTGFLGTGATVHDVSLIKGIVGDKLGIKASGGIRTKEDAIAMIEAGASRLGTSKSIQIVSE
ncbi:MAG: deoxyribose-phosphate aldolase [Finegoldia sp.]|nr:deoxyribose-phosphate aldolase [Finegoldia sp.]